MTILAPSRPSVLPSTWKNPIPAKRIFRENFILWILHKFSWKFHTVDFTKKFRENFIMLILPKIFVKISYCGFYPNCENFILWILPKFSWKFHTVDSTQILVNISYGGFYPNFREHFILWILPKAVQRIKAWLTLILLTWRIWWAPNNASRLQMGFNLAFKRLKSDKTSWYFIRRCMYLHDNLVTRVKRLPQIVIDNNRYYSIVI